MEKYLQAREYERTKILQECAIGYKPLTIKARIGEIARKGAQVPSNHKKLITLISIKAQIQKKWWIVNVFFCYLYWRYVIFIVYWIYYSTQGVPSSVGCVVYRSLQWKHRGAPLRSSHIIRISGESYETTHFRGFLEFPIICKWKMGERLPGRLE